MKYLLRRLLGVSVFEKQEYLMSSSLTFTPGSTVPYGKGVRKHFSKHIILYERNFQVTILKTNSNLAD